MRLGEFIPLGVLLPLVKTSQSPVPEGLSRSHTGRWERRWTTLVNPKEETGRSSSKYSCVGGENDVRSQDGEGEGRGELYHARFTYIQMLNW